jgi:magnesium-transporting ATPase (P-type)
MNIYTIPAIIYQIYDKRGTDIPHFRALITIVLILFLHLAHASLLFDFPIRSFIPWASTDNRQTQWLYGLLFFGIAIGALAVIFPKKKLDKIFFSEKQISNAKVLLILYFISCIVLLAVLLIRLGIQTGTIKA